MCNLILVLLVKWVATVDERMLFLHKQSAFDCKHFVNIVHFPAKYVVVVVVVLTSSSTIVLYVIKNRKPTFERI